MISECTFSIQNRIIDIFVLYDKNVLIGELRVKYESDNQSFAIRGKRVYLYAFRVRENLRNKATAVLPKSNELSLIILLNLEWKQSADENH